MLDFLFERNEQNEISNIYNYPRGRGATQIIILLAVNCSFMEKFVNHIDFLCKLYYNYNSNDIYY